MFKYIGDSRNKSNEGVHLESREGWQVAVELGMKRDLITMVPFSGTGVIVRL